MLVDNGASEHYFDDAINFKLRDRLDNHQVLDVARKITTAGGEQLDVVAQGLLSGIVADSKGVRRSVQHSSLVVPDLGCNLFSTKRAVSNGGVSIFDMDNPRRDCIRQANVEHRADTDR